MENDFKSSPWIRLSTGRVSPRKRGSRTISARLGVGVCSVLKARRRRSGPPRRLLATWWIRVFTSRVSPSRRHHSPPLPSLSPTASSHPRTPRDIVIMHRRCSSRNCWRMPTSHELTASEVQDAGVHEYTRHPTRVAAHPGVRNTREWVPHSSATLGCHSSAGVGLEPRVTRPASASAPGWALVPRSSALSTTSE
ncbi:hypothetical protein BDZ89DRAFT_1043027 [Hymenopellis radicata]|nr:hypothetical protein BDZ89DRAFT_1043027 [Hymenopellis radicata]